ncbi:MAG: hypothetical protein J2P23_05290 [Microlunatus sp.]|nr:hypothetical protein [Microlunatus sp.]
MIPSSYRRGSSGVRVVGVLAAAVLLAGCGNSTQPGSAGPAAGNGGTATVETHSGAMGTFLTDSSGHSLYLFAADRGAMSACSGACAAVWPPLTVKGKPTGTGAVQSSMLGTITRSDGTKQVTYGGHPLYTYKPDASAGATTGQGVSGFGAKWWLIAPSGQPITSTSKSPSSAPSSSSGGGGGGWA